LSNNSGMYFDGTLYLYDCLISDVFNLKATFPKGSSVYLRNPSPLELLVCVLGLGNHLGTIHLIPDGVNPPNEILEVEHWYDQGFFSEKHINKLALENCSCLSRHVKQDFVSNLVVYSSGTSGPPKAVTHSLVNLLGQYDYQKEPDHELIWGLTFDAYRMSGIQVLLNAFAKGQTVVCSMAGASLGSRIEDFVINNVSAVSATPSFFRLLLSFPDFENLKLKQITIGGEIVNQKLLDDLHVVFPNSRITHIYASTEIAFGFSVSDLLSGFPLNYMERDFGKYQLLNVDGELAIKFSCSQNPTEQEVFFTGDLISVTQQRVYFSGRRTNIVNVGGHKVNPEEVERAILEIAGVKEVRVFGISSSRLGEILTAEAVVNGNLTGQEVRIKLKKMLPPYKIPATVEVVREIKLNSNGKILRS
jgi:acyl-CoA synthetase (AMP-forming)/AMP-acid ligase II